MVQGTCIPRPSHARLTWPLTGEIPKGRRDRRECYCECRCRDCGVVADPLSLYYRTTRLRPCYGRYIGHCVGGTSAYDLLDFHGTFSSRYSLCPRAPHTTVPARSSFPAALMPRRCPLPHPRLCPPLHPQFTYPGPPTPRRIRK